MSAQRRWSGPPLGSMAVIGVGQIGGSVALSARVAGAVTEVVAWSRTKEKLDRAQALGIIVAYLEDSDLGRSNGTPLIASLKAAAASFDRCRIIPGVNQLYAFQNMVRVQIAPFDPDMAARLIEAAQQVIDAVQTEQQPPIRKEFSY